MDYIGNYDKCPECGSTNLHWMVTFCAVETLHEGGTTKQKLASRSKYLCGDCKWSSYAPKLKVVE